jgi:2'-5' RNA ligase
MPGQTHRLFFALLPDARVAGEIETAAAAIKGSGRIRGRWVKPSKYHLTVQFLGDHTTHAVRIIEQARTAAGNVRLAGFDVVLDRVETFGGQRRSPCLMRCTPASDRSTGSLRSALGDTLAGAGLSELLEDRFTPHVTIAYVDENLDAPIAVQPVCWHVGAFALVDSHVGESRHEVLDRWCLSP